MSEHYYRQDRHLRRHRNAKHFKWFLLGLVTAAPIIAVLLFFTTSLFIKEEQKPVTSEVQTSVITPSIEIFRSVFFQFQADKDWGEIANETTESKFVYRKFNENLIEAQLDIYVNQAADKNVNATRVLPVIPSEDMKKLNAKQVSEPCVEDGEKDQGYKMMTLLGVKFRCNTDATDYSVLVGAVNGGTLLEMIRPDGTDIAYVIHYRDLRAIPDFQDMQDIVDSFQTR